MLSIQDKLKNNIHSMVIALDGPAGSGKGTMGKILANRFQLTYIESGILYRLLAYQCLEKNIPLNNIEKIIFYSNEITFPAEVNKKLFTEEVANFASQIGSIEIVRNNINNYLRKIIKKVPRVIIEGRDIGTNVATNADLKIFLTASLKTRAERRFNQLINSGRECIMSELLIIMSERDKRDQNRECNPLQPASDAIIIDTSNLLPEMIINKIIEII